MIVSALVVAGSAALWAHREQARFEDEVKRLREEYIAHQKEKIRTRTLEAIGYIRYQKSRAEARLREHIKRRADEAYNIALRYYEKHKGVKSRSEIESTIKDVLSSMSWDDEKGDYFIETGDGVGVFNRNYSNFEGTDLKVDQAGDEDQITRCILDIANRQGEGFCRHSFHRPNDLTKSTSPKILFVKKLDPLDWIIVNGKHLADEERVIQDEILEHINRIKLNRDGYVFIVTYDGMMLTYPARGASMVDVVDVKGKNIYQAIMEVVRQGGGFVDYFMVNLGDEKTRHKISYCQGIDEWRWYVGYGVYTDGIEAVIARRSEALSARIRTQLLWALLAFAVLLGASLLIARGISRGLRENLDLFLRFFTRAAEHREPIPEARVTFAEFASLGRSANQMLRAMRRAEEENDRLQERLLRAQKMEAMGLMAGGVAHDLNNILSGLINVPELILLQMGDDDPMRESMLMMIESGTRAAGVVKDLLTISRGVVTQKELVDFNLHVGAIVDALCNSALAREAHGVTLRTRLALEPLTVMCSPIHLDKALMNLVNNALEELDEGGTITVSTMRFEAGEVLPGFQDVQPGRYAVLSVRDDGPGISAEDQARIFEPFYTKKAMGRSGTGLGLSIVWNTMMDHRGFIQLDSSPEGTEFRLYFPCADEPEPTPVEEERPLIKGKGRVLVVDDERVQRTIAREMLAALGYDVDVVSSGEEALSYLEREAVDLLLLDMMMGKGINGLETYRRVLQIRPQQRTIIATGFAHSQDVEDAIALGVDHCIHKPYRLASLSASLRQIFGEAPDA